MKDFFLFAGPNGSGKSTIIGPFLSDNTIEYLNADYCARADPEILKMQDGPEKSKRAQEETERRLKEMLDSGVSIAWETVFSHESRLKIMEYAKGEGYRIHLTYVTTKDPDINVERVHNRFLQGGHDVPENKIRERYKRSVSFLPRMVLAADEVLIYDNSYENTDPGLFFQRLIRNDLHDEPELIFWQSEDEDVNEWAIRHVVDPLADMGFYVQCIRI